VSGVFGLHPSRDSCAQAAEDEKLLIRDIRDYDLGATLEKKTPTAHA